MLGGDSVEGPPVALGLVAEIFDAIDVVGLMGKEFGMINAHVLEFRDVERVIAAEAVGADD